MIAPPVDSQQIVEVTHSGKTDDRYDGSKKVIDNCIFYKWVSNCLVISIRYSEPSQNKE